MDHKRKLVSEEIDPRSYDPKKVAKNVTGSVLYTIPGIGTIYGIYLGIHNSKKKEVIKRQNKRQADIDKDKRRKKKK